MLAVLSRPRAILHDSRKVLLQSRTQEALLQKGKRSSLLRSSLELLDSIFSRLLISSSLTKPCNKVPYWLSGTEARFSSNRMARPPDFSDKLHFRYYPARSTRWPDFQISAINCIFAIIPHDQFISGRAKLFLPKAVPVAVLSTRGPTRQKQPDGQTSRFQRQIAFSLLSRAISLSAAGHGRFLSVKPFYQGASNWVARF